MLQLAPVRLWKLFIASIARNRFVFKTGFYGDPQLSRQNKKSRHYKLNSRQDNVIWRQNKINSRQNTINSRQNKITHGRTTADQLVFFVLPWVNFVLPRVNFGLPWIRGLRMKSLFTSTRLVLVQCPGCHQSTVAIESIRTSWRLSAENHDKFRLWQIAQIATSPALWIHLNDLQPLKC